MKKWGMLIAALLMVTMVLSACGEKKSDKLVIGTSADFPPYEFHITNADGKDEIVGFDIEIAKEIAKDLGKELEIKDMIFDSLLNELESGRVDLVVSGLSPTPERAEQVDLSNIYYKAEQAIVTTTENSAKYATMESLEGANIGVQKSSIQEEIAQGIAGANLTSLAKINDIIMQLQSGRVDAAVLEGPVAEAFVKNVEGITITDAKPVTEDEGYVIGVKKGNTELLDQVNKTLERLMNDGSIDKFVAEASALAEK